MSPVPPDDGGGPLGFDADEQDRRPARRDPPPWPGVAPSGAAPPMAAGGGPDDDDAPRRIARRYGWVGLALIAALFLYATLRGTGEDGPGPRGVPVGSQAPPFAAPLAAGGPDGDVNVFEQATEVDGKRYPAACDVRAAGVLNLCALRARGPVVLGFFASQSAGCVRAVDRLDDARAAHPGVAFAAIAIGARGRSGEAGRVRALVARRRWRLPVAVDRDGVLTGLYGIAVCPQLTYVRRGGVVAGTSFGELDARALEARVAALERGAALPAG